MFWNNDEIRRRQDEERRQREKQLRKEQKKAQERAAKRRKEKEERDTLFQEQRRKLQDQYAEMLGDPLQSNKEPAFASCGLSRGLGAASHSRPDYESKRKAQKEGSASKTDAGSEAGGSQQPSVGGAPAFPKLNRGF